MAKELSDLIVYCQTKQVGITGAKLSNDDMKYCNMASMSEKAMRKVLEQFGRQERLIEYHKKVLSRIYPSGSHILSGNFNPIPYWKAGVQIAALNIQTVGQYSRINRTLFRANGNCGYVPKESLTKVRKI